jgi:phage/plasmid-associated DNA primase
VQLAATRDYLEAQDVLGLWVDERCDTSDPTAATRSSALYTAFRRWKEARGEGVPSQVRFSGQLEQRFSKGRDAGNYVVFNGIHLRDSTAPEGSEGSPL